LSKRKVGWKRSREIKRMIGIFALTVVFIAIVFVALRGLVGRKELDWDPLYYITFFAGSPIAAFDLFLKNPLEPSSIWGKETFYQLNQSISTWFNKPELRYIFYKEFRQSPSGIYVGNIYTALRPPYYDFGFWGMILVMFIMGGFFCILYCGARERWGKNPIDFRLLIYSYIAYTFFMYFYNCYNNFISFGFVRLVLQLVAFSVFLVGWHFRWSPRIYLGRKREQQ
jgi:oligosaccharide repeat unit polymerase